MICRTKEECSGCAACASVCPQKCIEMKPDEEGFLYPVIDEEKCVHCHACERVCPIQRSALLNQKEPDAYAAYSTDERVRATSSSGGVFTLLAEQILSAGGVVFGAAMSDDCKSVYHIEVSDLDDLALLRGSKYLQSNIADTFCQAKAHLTAGKPVLFSGTGCQINGLLGFLGKEYKNLYCVDVLCHGVPSPALWTKYVEYLEKENFSRLVGISFRCKDKGWSNFGRKEPDAGGRSVFISKDEDPFMQMFLRDHCLRPSCYNCSAKKEKLSDLTIGDFWGIDNVAPEMNDEKGVSLVLIRTEKGQKLFGQISAKMRCKQVSYQDGVKGNPAEYRSVDCPATRKSFFCDMNRLTFEQLKEKYAAPIRVSFKGRIKSLLKKCLKKVIKCMGWGGKRDPSFGILFVFEE